MKRSAYLGAAFIGFVVGFLLLFPMSCWQADCPASTPTCRASGCDNALGMTFDGQLVPIGVLGGFLGALLLIALVTATVRIMNRPAGSPHDG